MFRDRTRILIIIALLTAVTIALTVGIGSGESNTDAGGFEVEITGTNAPIAAGDTLVVNATITNSGDLEDSQQIHLKNGDEEIVDSIAQPPLTLAPGESKQVTLAWETAQGDAGDAEVSVQSDDAFPRESVDIRTGSFFEVSIVDVESSITAGEQLSVSMEVTNTGDITATKDVWFTLNGSTTESTRIELAPGQTQQLTLTWNSTANHVGEWVLTAATADTEERTALTVERDPDDTDRSSSSSDSDLVMSRSNALIEGSIATVSSHDITRVIFKEPTDGRISVSTLRGLPDDVEGTDDIVAIYRIDVPEGASNTAATIELTIDAETLDGAATEELLVKRWNGEEWEELDTNATQSNGTVTITVETDGFSLFAVTTSGQAGQETATQAPPSTDSSTATGTESTTQTATPSPTSSSVTEEGTSSQEVPGFGVVVAVFALLSAGILATHRRRIN